MARGIAHRLPWAEVRRLWEAGELSAEAIGRRYGVEGRVIRRAAAVMGWAPRTRLVAKPRVLREAEVWAMIEAGLPYEDIARAFGVSRRAVKQFAHRRGWRRPQGWRPAARLEDWPHIRLRARLARLAARETAAEQARRLGRRVAA